MEEKKKFEKPSMKVVELRSKVQILAGSSCYTHCGGDCSGHCGEDEEELCFIH